MNELKCLKLGLGVVHIKQPAGYSFALKTPFIKGYTEFAQN